MKPKEIKGSLTQASKVHSSMNQNQGVTDEDFHAIARILGISVDFLISGISKDQKMMDGRFANSKALAINGFC